MPPNQSSPSLIYFMKLPDSATLPRFGSVQHIDPDVFQMLKERSRQTGLPLNVITCQLLRNAFENVRLVEHEPLALKEVPFTEKLIQQLTITPDGEKGGYFSEKAL